MQSLKRHQHRQDQQLHDLSSSLKLPLNSTWNGAELNGGKLSPMHLDCCGSPTAEAPKSTVADGTVPVESRQLLTKADRDMSKDPPGRLSTASGNGAAASDQEAVIGSWPPLPPKGIRKKAAETLGFSAVAMEMLREQEDRDLHPFGRGGRFEGVLYSRRVKVQVDHTKFLAWIVFASFILLTSGAIIFLAEMERRQKSQQATSSTTTVSTIDGLLKANGTG